MRQTHVKILLMNVNALWSVYFLLILFQIYIWPDESLRRNQFRNGQTLDIRFIMTNEILSYNQILVLQPKPCTTAETLFSNWNIVLQLKPCATTETLCYNRNLVLHPKPCATTETLCYNRNNVLQPKPFATNKILCFNRNLVLQPKHCATTETLCYNRNLVLQPKPCATTETLCYNWNLVHSLKLKVGNEGFKTRSIVNEAKFLVCKEVTRWKSDWKLKPTLLEAKMRL
jgi:hypothetical protein